MRGRLKMTKKPIVHKVSKRKKQNIKPRMTKAKNNRLTDFGFACASVLGDNDTD